MNTEPRSEPDELGCLLLIIFLGVAWGTAIAAGVLTYRFIVG